MAKLDNKNAKTLVFRAKRRLRNTDHCSDVYIEPELSYEARQQQRNTKILLKAFGKEQEFHYINGRLVKRVAERQSQFYDRVRREQEEMSTRFGRGGYRNRQFVNT